MKLCIFPGTFNPIHRAHLKMAEYVVEHFGFDKILFIPAYNPPHKECKVCEHRLKMVELAIKDNLHFELSDIEYKREGKSYTYLTILELYKNFEIDGKINMIIGTDAFEKIESWYETDKLKELVEFIVFTRENEPVDLEFLREKGYNFKLAEMDFFDISSTELRNKIAVNECVDDIVTKKVKDYIEENGLYRN